MNDSARLIYSDNVHIRIKIFAVNGPREHGADSRESNNATIRVTQSDKTARWIDCDDRRPVEANNYNFIRTTR